MIEPERHAWNDAGYIEVGRGEKRIDWGDATVDTVSIERKAVTPADIALGWLLASKAMPSYGEIRYDTQCDRAAVCAELVALAGQVGRMPVVFVEPNDAMRQKYQDILRHFGGIAVSLMTEPVEFIPGGVLSSNYRAMLDSGRFAIPTAASWRR